jgi:hypothetical protein
MRSFRFSTWFLKTFGVSLSFPVRICRITDPNLVGISTVNYVDSREYFLRFFLSHLFYLLWTFLDVVSMKSRKGQGPQPGVDWARVRGFWRSFQRQNPINRPCCYLHTPIF